MREILFRGKRIDNGEWVEGFLVKHPSAACIGDYSPWYISVPPKDPDDNGGLYNISVESIGQFTGLTDKNDKKIFEDDIIVIRNCKEHPVLVKFLDFSWQCVIPNINAYIHYRHRLEENNIKYVSGIKKQASEKEQQ